MSEDHQRSTDRKLQMGWWDPRRGPVTATNDRPAVRIQVLYDPSRQVHWEVQRALSSTYDQIYRQLELEHHRVDDDDLFGRCPAIGYLRGRCIYYADHLGMHEWEPNR